MQESPFCSMSTMSQEILAFILTISGWVLVSSTLPTDYWQVSSNDGDVITTSTFWSNLWKACVTDSTGVSNCRDFPSMLALDGKFVLGCLVFVFNFSFHYRLKIMVKISSCVYQMKHLFWCNVIFSACFSWFRWFSQLSVYIKYFGILVSSVRKLMLQGITNGYCKD